MKRLHCQTAFGWLIIYTFCPIQAPATQENYQPGKSSITLAPEVKVPYSLPAAGTLPTAGAIAPAATQPQGALTGRIVFTGAGHGWTWNGSSWGLQRPLLLEMNEDYGNLDQMTMFAFYCFNAGATVVPMRPIGHQTNEVVLDNTSPAASFSGSWSDETVEAVYYGQALDAIRFRRVAVSSSETATATYTPTIPVAGLYPVYTWVPHGANRTNQLYRIRHTGGEAQTRVPHHRVGRGWVYLGSYYFNAGSNAAAGAVVISNLQPGAQPGSVAVADAIRFGNGMGSINRGGGVSGFPREEEASRYWVQNSIGQGQSTNIYDVTGLTDQDDNVGSPPRMAREMNREADGNLSDRVYVGFHSNAAGGSGALGLYNSTLGDRTPNQFLLADTIGREVNQDMAAISAFLEVPWASSGNNLGGSFGEIRNTSISNEFDATIIEVAFHDNASDALLLRDPKARSWIARATYHGVVKYMNALDNLSTNFLPEPPVNVRVQGTSNGMVLSWSAPIAQAGSGAPTGYVHYRSADGFGFGNGVSVAGGGTTSVTVTNLGVDTDYFFRIAAVNAGGESFPSEVVGCRRGTNASAPKILFVNAFDRFDRTINLRQTPSSGNYRPPGHDANTGVIDRVIARGNNAFDYVRPHGLALGAAGRPYDSCANEAVANGDVILSNYTAAIWACGQESVADESFSAIEQTALTAYLGGGSGLFVSGSEIAWDLDRSSGPTAADRGFLNNLLHARLVDDTNDHAMSYSVSPTGGGIFAGQPGASFDSGTNGIYAVRTPDVLTTNGAGTLRALSYGGSSRTAALQYDGSAGGGRIVYFGFPFESITGAAARNDYMASILSFLAVPASNNLPLIVSSPQSQFVVQGSNVTLSVSAVGTAPLSYHWRFNGFALPGFTSSSLTRSNAQPADSGNYQVTVSNAYGMATSEVAQLTVTLPTVVQTLFQDDFDTNSSGNWWINSSSLDTRVTFDYNYANDGIAAAPQSIGGTTRGVKFEANLSNGVAAAVSISPIGQNFAGDYRLRFDMWINVNGPFPTGGLGSTEHFTAGVGTSGNQVQWTGPGPVADGHWFAVDGEGGSSDATTTSLPDFAAHSGANLHAATSGIYAAGVAVSSRGNGHPYYAGTLPAGKTAPALQMQNYPQQIGSLNVGTAGFAWHDVVVEKRGSTVSWSIDGLRIASITNATFNASNIFVGYWDSYPSVSDNPALSFGLVDNVSVGFFITNVPPFITAHPQSQTAAPGGSAAFTVTAGGTALLSYQWQRSGTNLAGATLSAYSLSNLQPSAAGIYSVVVSNLAGTVMSSNALLSVVAPQPPEFVWIEMLTNTQVRLVLSSATGAALSLERSANFSNWTELTRLTNHGGTMEYVDEAPTNQVQSFYRVILLP